MKLVQLKCPNCGADISIENISKHHKNLLDNKKDKPILDHAEALVRRNSPKFGFVSPGDFIPLFVKCLFWRSKYSKFIKLYWRI